MNVYESNDLTSKCCNAVSSDIYRTRQGSYIGACNICNEFAEFSYPNSKTNTIYKPNIESLMKHHQMVVDKSDNLENISIAKGWVYALKYIIKNYNLEEK